MFESTSSTSSRPFEPRSTRVLLLETAERLFAQRGLAAVSLRQIATAAGQRNPAVVQYHFGSKEQLIGAIIEMRVESIDERRVGLLAGGRLRGTHELRRILRAIVVPLHELAAGTHYVRFLANLAATPRGLQDAFEGIDSSTGVGGRMVAEAMHDALEAQPEPIRNVRISMVLRLVLGTLAVRHEDGECGVDDGLTDAEFIDNLVESAVGLLNAPLVPDQR